MDTYSALDAMPLVVSTWTRYWHGYRSELETIEKWAKASTEDERSRLSWVVVRRTRYERRLWRRYLRSRFGFRCNLPRRALGPSRPPRTTPERARYIWAAAQLHFWSNAFARVMEARYLALDEDRDPALPIINAMAAWYKEWPILFCRGMELTPHPIGEAMTYIVAGWARSSLSLSHNRRLDEAIRLASAESQTDLEIALCQMLPHAAILAWAERRNDNLRIVRNGIANILERERSKDRARNGWLSESAGELECDEPIGLDSVPEVAARTFQLYEEARWEAARQENIAIDLTELAEKACLLPREREVLALLCEDDSLSQQEIAARLGVTRSTAGVHKHNLARKLRKARESLTKTQPE